jgi:hypothetical protein
MVSQGNRWQNRDAVIEFLQGELGADYDDRAAHLALVLAVRGPPPNQAQFNMILSSYGIAEVTPPGITYQSLWEWANECHKGFPIGTIKKSTGFRW